MKIIPLPAFASQTFNVVLAGQSCALNLYQKSTGLYLDLAIAGRAVASGVLCRDRVKLLRQEYLGFLGDLAFMDTQGQDDPHFDGLGSRWVLVYLEPEDVAA